MDRRVGGILKKIADARETEKKGVDGSVGSSERGKRGGV